MRKGKEKEEKEEEVKKPEDRIWDTKAKPNSEKGIAAPSSSELHDYLIYLSINLSIELEFSH